MSWNNEGVGGCLAGDPVRSRMATDTRQFSSPALTVCTLWLKVTKAEMLQAVLAQYAMIQGAPFERGSDGNYLINKQLLITLEALP